MDEWMTWCMDGWMVAGWVDEPWDYHKLDLSPLTLHHLSVLAENQCIILWCIHVPQLY